MAKLQQKRTYTLKSYVGLYVFNRMLEYYQDIHDVLQARLQVLDELKTDNNILHSLLEFFCHEYSHWFSCSKCQQLYSMDSVVHRCLRCNIVPLYDRCKYYIERLSDVNMHSEIEIRMMQNLPKFRHYSSHVNPGKVASVEMKTCNIHHYITKYIRDGYCNACYNRVHKIKEAGLFEKLSEKQLEIALLLPKNFNSDGRSKNNISFIMAVERIIERGEEIDQQVDSQL